MLTKVFIQNEKNSAIRYSYNEKNLTQKGKSELLIPAAYQYGFIPETLGDDGDCIDAWLISERNFKVGMIVKCRVLGMLEMFESFEGEREKDFKIFTCPVDENCMHLNAVIDEIKVFTVEIFKKFPDVTITFGEFHGPKMAESFLIDSI